jgi:hypothetical protein
LSESLRDRGASLAEAFEAVVVVAKRHGIRSASVAMGDVIFRFVLPTAAPTVQASGPTVRPISVPNTETDDAVRATKRRNVAAYLDAVECAHINGYPNLSDYGLVPGDI